MPEINRAQIATYAVLALVVVVLGVRFMQRQQPASAVVGSSVAECSMPLVPAPYSRVPRRTRCSRQPKQSMAAKVFFTS